MHIIKGCTLVAILSLASGCASTLQREGAFTLLTDAEGLRAFSDYQVGVANEAKATPEKPAQYWSFRGLKPLTIGRGQNAGKSGS